MTTFRALLFIPLLLTAACASKRIPGTELEDTDDTRAILAVMERYRSALEAKDAKAIQGLVSEAFREDGGTETPDDDLTYANLGEHLDRAERERSHGLQPNGIIHADLFMDNVKWLADRVGAFFDFEMACRDAYGLDVAITLNAWCFDGKYLPELCRAFIRGYQEARALLPVERESLFGHALFGSVRYTASRIRDFHLSPLPPEQLTRKDFRTYLARARALDAMGPAGLKALLGL